MKNKKDKNNPHYHCGACKKIFASPALLMEHLKKCKIAAIGKNMYDAAISGDVGKIKKFSELTDER